MNERDFVRTSKRAYPVAVVAIAASLLLTAGSCGPDGNIISTRPVDSDTYEVAVKDKVTDKPEDAVWVKLDIKYQATCVVGAQYPQCKKEYDDQH